MLVNPWVLPSMGSRFILSHSRKPATSDRVGGPEAILVVVAAVVVVVAAVVGGAVEVVEAAVVVDGTVVVVTGGAVEVVVVPAPSPQPMTTTVMATHSSARPSLCPTKRIALTPSPAATA